MPSDHSPQHKVRIQRYLKAYNKIPARKQRFGFLAPVLGYILIISFSIFLFPLYIYLIVFNITYFWIRKQKSVCRQDYFEYDRHHVEHLSISDKIWCEYCEWANGTLQWALAITNEIERRYCPIRNRKHESLTYKKDWRDEFLDYDHTIEDIERYYNEDYPRHSYDE